MIRRRRKKKHEIMHSYNSIYHSVKKNSRFYVVFYLLTIYFLFKRFRSYKFQFWSYHLILTLWLLTNLMLIYDKKDLEISTIQLHHLRIKAKNCFTLNESYMIGISFIDTGWSGFLKKTKCGSRP